MSGLSLKKPWFNSPYVGVGLSLPIAWQGWALLAAGFGGAVLCLALLPRAVSVDAGTALLLLTMVAIHVTRKA